MTVRELMQKLSEMPEDATVMLPVGITEDTELEDVFFLECSGTVELA